MKTKLITALRTAAKAIEDGTIDYDWNRAERCNCGVLACAITGKSPSELNLPTTVSNGNFLPDWKHIVGQHCPITGIPTHEVLKALFQAGLVQKDLIELERLSNPEILKRAGFGERFDKRTIPAKRKFFRVIPEHTVDVHVVVSPKHDFANHVIHYMRAWADILVEEGQQDSVSQTQEMECYENRT